MFSRFTKHFRQQLVGYIALFIAMGGVSYAAVTLPAHSVGTKQLKNGAVTPPKVAPSTIALFKGQRGLQGTQGVRGPTGNTGTPGVPGADGKNGITGVPGADGKNGTNGTNGTNGINGTNGATNVVIRSNIGTDVSCNPGEVATGGGVNPDNSTVTSSYPTGGVTPTGWHGTEANNGNVNQFLPTVYVICASP